VLTKSAFSGEVLNAFFGAAPRHPALQPLVWAALHIIESAHHGYGKKLGPTAVAGPSAREDRAAERSMHVAPSLLPHAPAPAPPLTPPSLAA
jgi:hypothetical protein